ncbi:hypothetical protein NDU88_004349 [Pleurodeles waltl]|uniref:C3H1-type domain-containing protein n=1 Tax=Pleurodeles waltl TaxID=8319 RepID=A0AAV7L166_PLEWA|nr:hypothetical protein NDU88_004349 [Pleurodeles waltl]
MGKRRCRPPLIWRPPPAQIALPDTPAPSAVPSPAPPVLNTGTTASPGLCLEGVLADICKSLAALASTAQSGASPTPLPGIAVPAPPGPPPVRFSEQASINSPSVAPTPSTVLTSPPLVQNVLPSSSKVPGQVNPTKEGTTDLLLSRPGKLAAHVSTEVKEKIWKGEFVDIFSLIRAKRTKFEGKEKEPKSSCYVERKPKIEENITNWLFGFNVFMSILLRKKPELGTSLIYYENKILKAQHTYGGLAWLEYDRDFRWDKVEDPSIGWDQTEVNVWLECVNNKASGQPFRPQVSGKKKGSCWAFNRKVCSLPAGTCKFRHNCSFCGHPSHPESKCIKKSKERSRDTSKPSN